MPVKLQEHAPDSWLCDTDYVTQHKEVGDVRPEPRGSVLDGAGGDPAIRTFAVATRNHFGFPSPDV